MNNKHIREGHDNNYAEPSPFIIQMLKSRIVTQISHEFRTPLTSIVGFAEMLAESEGIDDHRRVEYARYIMNEGLRLSKLITDYLELESSEQCLMHSPLKRSETNEAV